MTKFTGRIASGVAAVALFFGATLALAGPASAATKAPPVSPETQTQTQTSDACLEEIKNAIKNGATGLSTDVCTTTTTLTVGFPETLTSADVQALKGSMSSADYTSLVTAAATSTIHSKSYSQTMNNITDQERQYGTFYYNGSRAWVTVTYSGRTGTHFCKVDWAVGYAVSLIGCTEGGSTTQRNLHAQWKFSLIANGSPIAWDEVYTLHVNSSGSIWQ